MAARRKRRRDQRVHSETHIRSRRRGLAEYRGALRLLFGLAGSDDDKRANIVAYGASIGVHGQLYIYIYIYSLGL